MRIPFDQYQRYKNAQVIIENLRINKSHNIIEIGANEHRNLEKFLPNDKIKYLDIVVPDYLKSDPDYIEGDATNLEISDNSFDFVVALDVYEHIPSKKREAFIKELNRVSKYGVIISAPFNFKYVKMAEERLNQYYLGLHKQEYIWLKEHIENELPDLSKTRSILHEINCNYFIFSHGNIDIWEKMTRIHFTFAAKENLIPYRFMIDEYYNSSIFKNDYDELGYRNFIVYGKDKQNIEKMKVNLEPQMNAVKLAYSEHMSKLDELEKSIFNIDNEITITETNTKLDRILFEMKGFSDISYNKRLKTNKEVTSKIYFSSNEVFNEENMKVIRLKSGDTYNFLLHNHDGNVTKNIRIDPAEANVYLKISKLEAVLTDKSIIDLIPIISANTDYREGSKYLFNTTDPQIYVCIESYSVESLNINFEYIALDFKNIGYEKTLIDKYNELKEENIKLSEYIKQIKSTKTWKLLNMLNPK